MRQIFPGLDPQNYVQHPLHSSERMWPETNCYIDLWIEVLASKGLPPEAMFGFTLTQDFEGDQFTFFKVPLEDLEALYGVRTTELAIFDRVENHIDAQLARGRICLIEMDSFYMPDTHGVGYRKEHGKTTIAINRLDLENRELDYFHNAGFFHLAGEDFDGLFQHHLAETDPPFLPYTEFAKFADSSPSPAHIRKTAERLLKFHFSRRPSTNPVRAFAGVFPTQVEKVADRPFGFFTNTRSTRCASSAPISNWRQATSNGWTRTVFLKQETTRSRFPRLPRPCSSSLPAPSPAANLMRWPPCSIQQRMHGTA